MSSAPSGILTQRRSILDGLIAAHRGRIAHSAGGNVLAEFGSAVAAGQCAVAAQEALAEGNAGGIGRRQASRAERARCARSEEEREERPMECPSCKADVPVGSNFCTGCGAAAPIRCAACGAQNRAGSKFCSECGASLAAPTAGSLAAAPTADSAQQPIPSPERRQLTVMFCDLVGSTALSTRLDPEDTREIISAYHRCCAETITRSGGFVAKYMGEG